MSEKEGIKTYNISDFDQAEITIVGKTGKKMTFSEYMNKIISEDKKQPT